MANREVLKWLQGQAARIKEQVMDEEFAHINYAELVPVTSEGNPWQQAVAFVSTDSVGKAEFINGNADDVPLADVNVGGRIAPVHFAAIGYGYGYDEINSARVMGIDLSTRKASAARLACEEFTQELAFSGSREKGLTGLINQPSASVTRDTDNTDWSAVTAEEALALVNKAISLTGNKGAPTADTVILPYSLYERLAGLLMPNGAQTALDFITTNNIAASRGRRVEVLSLDELDTAASGNKPRIVAYRRDPNVLELAVPMPHMFLDVHHAAALRWEVPGVFRTAGVNVVRKRDFAYLDNTAS